MLLPVLAASIEQQAHGLTPPIPRGGFHVTDGAPFTSIHHTRFTRRQSEHVYMCVPAFCPEPRLSIAPHQTFAA